jgi:hypothetical protein
MTALLKKASFYLNLAPLNKIPLFDNGAAEIFHTFGSKNIESRRGETKANSSLASPCEYMESRTNKPAGPIRSK